MAKKKRSTRRRTYRRRIGAKKNGFDVNSAALAVAGAIAAKIIAGKLSTSTNPTFQKFGPYVPLAAGIILPMVVKNPMVASISIGLIAEGGVAAVGPKGLKLISGLDVISKVGYNSAKKMLPYKAVAGLPAFSNANKSPLRQPGLDVISGTF